MKVGETVLALDLVDSQLDLTERMVLVFLEVSKGDLKDPALESFVGVLETGGTVDESLSNTTNSQPLSALPIYMPSSSSYPHIYPFYLHTDIPFLHSNRGRWKSHSLIWKVEGA